MLTVSLLSQSKLEMISNLHSHFFTGGTKKNRIISKDSKYDAKIYIRLFVKQYVRKKPIDDNSITKYNLIKMHNLL